MARRTNSNQTLAGGAFIVALNGDTTMDGRILECEPLRRLVLAWHETSDGAGLPYATRPDDTSLVTFDLEPTAEGGTRLVFTHQYIRDGDIMVGFGAGWHALLDALKTHVDELPGVDGIALYERLKPRYDVVVGIGGSPSTVRSLRSGQRAKPSGLLRSVRQVSTLVPSAL